MQAITSPVNLLAPPPLPAWRPCCHCPPSGPAPAKICHLASHGPVRAVRFTKHLFKNSGSRNAAVRSKQQAAASICIGCPNGLFTCNVSTSHRRPRCAPPAAVSALRPSRGTWRAAAPRSGRPVQRLQAPLPPAPQGPGGGGSKDDRQGLSNRVAAAAQLVVGSLAQPNGSTHTLAV